MAQVVSVGGHSTCRHSLSQSRRLAHTFATWGDDNTRESGDWVI
jgi:hypothetical protein